MSSRLAFCFQGTHCMKFACNVEWFPIKMGDYMQNLPNYSNFILHKLLSSVGDSFLGAVFFDSGHGPLLMTCCYFAFNQTIRKNCGLLTDHTVKVFIGTTLAHTRLPRIPRVLTLVGQHCQQQSFSLTMSSRLLWKQIFQDVNFGEQLGPCSLFSFH